MTAKMGCAFLTWQYVTEVLHNLNACQTFGSTAYAGQCNGYRLPHSH
jgi:hypothetical protein